MCPPIASRWPLPARAAQEEQFPPVGSLSLQPGENSRAANGRAETENDNGCETRFRIAGALKSSRSASCMRQASTRRDQFLEIGNDLLEWIQPSLAKIPARRTQLSRARAAGWPDSERLNLRPDSGRAQPRLRAASEDFRGLRLAAGAARRASETRGIRGRPKTDAGEIHLLSEEDDGVKIARGPRDGVRTA